MTIWSPIQAYQYAYKHGLNFPRDAKISEHFYWWEVFLNQQNESVPPVVIFFNAKKMADELEKYRSREGKPIHIHRWYSSPRYNKDVVYGGNADKGTLSLHTLGLAVDFHEDGRTGEQTRLSILDYVRKDIVRVRIERGTPHCHADVGHPYIPGGYVWGLFYP